MMHAQASTPRSSPRPQRRDISSMEDCMQKLGGLDDELAGIQAEVKVNGMNDQFLCRTSRVGTYKIEYVSL